ALSTTQGTAVALVGDGGWWRSAVVYQVYPRSFADSDGDGVGDLPGVSAHLGDLAALGVDAVWLSPFYPSPQVDGGYDISDYCGVDPLLGTLDDVDVLLAEAHRLGLRVIVDVVPNHTSSAHPWFVAALAAAPGSPERDRYLFRDEPTDWMSVFGGPAWTQVPDGQWYLHLFDSAQPDLNWTSASVRADFDDVLRFWLDRGVDGFRIDVGHGLVKDPTFPSFPGSPLATGAKQQAPYWDQEGVHDLHRHWRRLADSYADRPRMLCGEVNVGVDRAVRYVRPDELHQVFNWPFLVTHWEPVALRTVVDESVSAYGGVGAAPSWVLGNHDTLRVASRFGYPVGEAPRRVGPRSVQPDVELGLRRARAAALLMLALPGSAYVYQGDELGLGEHTTLADADRQDPAFARTRGEDLGRDGCRVPLPWEADAPNLGFGAGRPWLPQPEAYAALARDRQRQDPASTLALWTEAIRLRRDLGLGGGEVTWTSAPDDAVLALSNGPVRVTANLSGSTVGLPADAEVLLSSEPGSGREVPPD
ncbi:MAG: glycoside hydrolase family 13 protein, partial [Janthinobacterium lividum]